MKFLEKEGFGAIKMHKPFRFEKRSSSMLINGSWKTPGSSKSLPLGSFRHQISSSEESEYSPQKGRYHLYVSYACPWSHRALIMRRLKGLEDVISVSSADFF